MFVGCLDGNGTATPTPSIPTVTPTSAPTASIAPSATASAAEQGCIASGGTVTTANCCESAGDFPNSCAIGACGCAPEYSHPVKICGCGNKCFNGDTCVTFEEGDRAASASTDRFVWIASKDSSKVAKLYESNGTFAGFYAAGAVPVSVAVDAEGNVWVADGSEGNGEVTKLNPTGAFIGTYVVGTAHKEIAIDPSGNVWVTDIGDKIDKLAPNGSVLGVFTVGMDPVDILADADGNIWVSNTPTAEVNGDIVKLDSEGKIIGNFTFYPSTGLLALDADGNILVSSVGSQIIKLDSSGRKVAEYNYSGAIDMALDADGNIWFTDSAEEGTVTKLDSGGGLLGKYGVGNTPLGVSIDYDGNVWVSNYESSFVTKLNGETGALIGNYETGGCDWNFGDATGFAYHHFVLRDR
ncbi:hypothetical protein COX86_00850 [Candidatus Micrarchaeota archaeon CG_4_10_14_0_2_um_filter_60_11]|nr:MAG: hypothetical protein AUJ16_00545 [Candidatus Micrarchaeota archaeon CG1_02_60_51]PIN95973.1 MAG: hypothetical protein COU39_03125 [Candidatus Micrarchaeota archaeon CG10_big_fil_rev_8_21_14_0_10_60_32]PIO02173.1 MAG: hypothetical protein COT58_01430 [Candidatus Micrarchaeota archaeon CG09_land_8_20_14_0_10_60_16]PIY91633.1 MAG: hypothetical protein COY71_02165 [Candidatus Micrarchaeota archaeon CG_4_10_14_0_8_um_filter_60_7]PIZ91222.1 MAG: hypothetical protein COX86_00850 [Candidatus Mi